MPRKPLAAVPLDDPNSRPVAIGIGQNPVMKRWDITVMIGNFATEEDAKEYVDRLAEILQEPPLSLKLDRMQ